MLKMIKSYSDKQYFSNLLNLIINLSEKEDFASSVSNISIALNNHFAQLCSKNQKGDM